MSSVRAKPELLNSSFYSSNSINTLDHAKTFRNSLILNVLSDNSIANSVDNDGEEDYEGADATYVEDNESDQAVKRDEYSSSSTLRNETFQSKERARKIETQTINMSTSPSLSALANILQEKSKTADQKMRNSVLLNVTEEQEEESITDNVISNNSLTLQNINTERQHVDNVEEQHMNNMTAENADIIASPNLIDLDGTNNINFTTIDSTQDAQPDFLTTPKVEQGQNLQKNNFVSSLNAIEESPAKISKVTPEETSRQTQIPASSATDMFNNNDQLKQNMRSISENVLNSTINEHRHEPQQNIFNKPLQYNSSTTSLPQGANHVQPIQRSVTNEQIKSNLLRKGPRMNASERASRTVSTGPVLEQTSNYKEKKGFFSFLKKKNKNNNKKKVASSNEQSTSTFNSISSKSISSELPKKSHSNNNIFGNFKKKKSDVREADAADTSFSSTSNTNLNIPKVRNQASANIPTPFANITETNHREDIQKRKPTPLDFESPLVVNTEVPKESIFEGEHNDKNYILASPDVGSPAFSLPKPDAGEALFPKFLNSFEVDSIVSLERTRSIKSNKRSSMNSYRRSLTDNLSINAQNEGMFITEVGSAVLSTPDLTKSPASSILRSGKFEAPMEMDTPSDIEESDLLNNDNNVINEMTNKHEEYDNTFTMKNMETEFEQILSVQEKSEQSYANHNPNTEEKNKEVYEEDQQLMTDIMDFANIIDFGDEIDLGLGLSLNNDNTYPESKNEPLNVSKQYSDQTNIIPTVTVNNDPVPDESAMKMSDQEENEEVFKYEIIQDRNAKAPALPSPPLSEEGGFSISLDANSFENENFNEIEEDHFFTEDDLVGIDTDGNIIREPAIKESYGLKGEALNFIDEEEQRPASTRPQLKMSVSFSSEILLFETYGEEDYDRRPEIATCNQLTPQLAQMIKAELNELKDEMIIHEESRCYTHYY